MREPFLRLLQDYILQVSKAAVAIEIYAEVIANIEKKKAEIHPTWKEFREKSDDHEYIATLTVEEQQALGANEINYKKVLREMDESIAHLSKQRYTNDVRVAHWFLDDLRLMLSDLLTDSNLTEVGKEIKTKTLLNYDRFDKANYVSKITMVQTMIEVIRDEVLAVGNFGEDDPRIPMIQFYISMGLGKVVQILQQDMEYIEENGMPDLWKFRIPDIVVPKIPEEAPDPTKEKAELEEVVEAEEGQ